jgi:hypothetical protein
VRRVDLARATLWTHLVGFCCGKEKTMKFLTIGLPFALLGAPTSASAGVIHISDSLPFATFLSASNPSPGEGVISVVVIVILGVVARFRSYIV